MKRIRRCKVGFNVNQDAINAYNRMHFGYKVRMEWGMGGSKRKWRVLMKRFDSTKLKYTHLFKAATIFTNVLHRHIMDFTFEVISHLNAQLANHGWDKKIGFTSLKSL